jgi:hypothetical protein
MHTATELVSSKAWRMFMHGAPVPGQLILVLSAGEAPVIPPHAQTVKRIVTFLGEFLWAPIWEPINIK